MRLRWVVAAGVVLAAGATVVIVDRAEPERSQYCVARVGELGARVDLEQARWTTLMSAVADRRGLPPRATTIAIATAYQESRLHNIDYGDRDSLGLFQQRPSQGWGSPEQIMDPLYAIERFYDGLEQVPGYTDLEITVAAQAVQRSAFPEAYAAHEDYARALASAQRGHSPAAFECRIEPTEDGSADAVSEALRSAYGEVTTAPTDEGIDIDVSSAGDPSVRGWALAHFLVGNAAGLGIAEVSFDGRTWRAADYDEGWAEDSASSPSLVSVRLG